MTEMMNPSRASALVPLGTDGYGCRDSRRAMRGFLELEASDMVLAFFFQAEDGIRDVAVTGVQTCALPILNLDPDTPLPPPPKKVEVEDGLPEASALRASALARRPDLRALANRIAADEASLRSEERRVGKEWRCRGSPAQLRQNNHRATASR